MTIQRMHHLIKLGYNKLNSNHKQDLPSAYIDDVINEAITELVEIFYSGENVYGLDLGFEITQQMIDYLQPLVVPDIVITPTASTLQYTPYIIQLPDNYLHLIKCNHSESECSNKYIEVDVIRHNDFDTKIHDDNQKPSSVFKRSLGLIKNNQLYIYSENTPRQVYLSYLKKPTKVFFGGYNSLEFTFGDTAAYNTASASVNSEFSETVNSLIIKVSIQKLADYFEDYNKSQNFENRFIKTT